MLTPHLLRSLSFMLPVLVAAGCSPSPDSSKPPAPAAATPQESFSDAVSGVISLRDSIRDGFAAGDVDAAHGPLHEIGYQLEKIPALAVTANLSSEEIDQVKSATDGLMDAFGAVDKTLHGGEGSTYEEEAQKIDAGVKILADFAGIASGDDVSPDQPQSSEPEPSPEVQDAEVQDAEVQDAVIPSEAPAPVPDPEK